MNEREIDPFPDIHPRPQSQALTVLILGAILNNAMFSANPRAYVETT